MKNKTRRTIAYLLFPWMIGTLCVVELFVDICDVCQTCLWTLLNTPGIVILLVAKKEKDER